ncbi:MAG: hypothetical protein WBI07_14490 [Mobilitalea sp.]
MEVKVCKNCRRLFNHINGPDLCQECMKLLPKEEEGRVNIRMNSGLSHSLVQEEEKYIKVREYVALYPGATIVQIADANGVTPSKIFEWIREDRMEFSEESKEVWFTCAKCGVKIKSGRYCVQCRGK